MATSSTLQRAQRFAEAASTVADEASRIVLARLGECHASDVARRAAEQTHEAVAQLEKAARDGNATLEETIQAATWAMSSAAIALTQIKLDPPRPRAARRSRLDKKE